MAETISLDLAPTYDQLRPVDAQAEQAYRQELTNGIVESSVGTVGLYTSADLSPEDSQALSAKLNERNPGQSFRTSNGGWSNWGERKLVDESDAMRIYGKLDSTKQWDEQVHFMELPDGKVDVRYGFTSKGYKDGTGRPGNALMVGFQVPVAKANELWHAIQADPSFMVDVVEAQVKALGISNRQWAAKMRPNEGFSNPIQQKDKTLTIVKRAPDASVASEEQLIYGENKPIAPVSAAPELIPTVPETAPVPVPTPEVAETAELSTEARYEEIIESERKSIKNELEKGVPAEKILQELADLAVQFERNADEYAEKDDWDLMAINDVMARAYSDVYREYLAADIQANGFGSAYERFTQVMDDYLQLQLDAGAPLKSITIPTVSMESFNQPSAPMLYERNLIESVLQAANHPLTQKDMVSALNHVKRAYTAKQRI